MSFSAVVVADSVSSWGVRLTTLQLRYPRFIHPEFMTHRAFSRNASSSRAIPTKRLIEDVERDLAAPIFWGKNQPGMQARVELDEDAKRVAKATWFKSADLALEMAKRLADCGAHKQIVNRVLEPYAHINVVVTATDWDNFFKLRLHPDAQPEIYELARVMKEAMDASPQLAASVHLPYVQLSERGYHSYDVLAKISAARCARVSYMTHEGKTPDFDTDMALAERLLASKHMSPFEHAARALNDARSLAANLRGWCSYRTSLESTVIESFFAPT